MFRRHVRAVAFATLVIGTAPRLLAQSSTTFVATRAAIAAPSPKAIVRPDYKNLRFDESWLPANRSGAWDDAIKAIPLWGNRPLLLTIGGQARWRQEFVRAFNLTTQNDDYSQSRLLLSADLVGGDRKHSYARGFVEARDAQSYGRTLPGGARPNDADRHDLQNAFVEAGYARSFVRYGRQEVAVGRERLVGVPDWSNTRRGSQGLRAQATAHSIAVEVLDVRPMIMRQELANRADSTTHLRSVLVGNSAGAKAVAPFAPSLWQLYHHEQRVLSPTSNVRRVTTGARAQWQWGSRLSRSIEVEGASQSGYSAQRRLDAWFWVAEAQQQWKRVHGAPALILGLEEASGDRPSTTSRSEAFSVLFPAAHAHGGYADVFGRANLREFHAIGTWLPVSSVDLRLAAYRFDRRRLDDGVWTKTNTVFRAAGSSTARHVGDEFDLTGTWKQSRHLRFIFGGAVVPPGAFLRDTGAAHTERWAFVGSTFTF